MNEETEKLEEKFQEFLEKECQPTYDLDDNLIKVMRHAFNRGALVGVDLFLEFYHEYKKELNDDSE